jgi:hypothetical protein
MDSYGDVVGVLTVVVMIRVGWSVAKAAWRDIDRPRPGLVLDLRADTSSDTPR